MRCSLLLLIILFFAKPFIAFAQQGNNKIEGDFKGLTAAQFFEKLEKLAPYKFYYDSAQVDSLDIQVTANGQTLQELLKEAFKGTDIHYQETSDSNRSAKEFL